MMCAAGRVCVAEVERLVEVGEIDPDQVHVPSIYVTRVVVAKDLKKPIERRTVRPRPR
jgi:3-oxoacid CoA-transferase subunit A